jgi:hypothetical protein
MYISQYAKKPPNVGKRSGVTKQCGVSTRLYTALLRYTISIFSGILQIFAKYPLTVSAGHNVH